MPRALRLAARRIKAAGYFLLGELALLVFKGLRLTNPAWAADKSGKLLRFIGPWLPEHRTGRVNLQSAFPDWPAEKVEQALGELYELMGDTDRSERLIAWVTDQSITNYLAISETYDEGNGTYKFNAPIEWILSTRFSF